MHCPLVCGVIMLEVQRYCDKYCRTEINKLPYGSWRLGDRGWVLGVDSGYGSGTLRYPSLCLILKYLFKFATFVMKSLIPSHFTPDFGGNSALFVPYPTPASY
jgi:hypothetical protein